MLLRIKIRQVFSRNTTSSIYLLEIGRLVSVLLYHLQTFLIKLTQLFYNLNTNILKHKLVYNSKLSDLFDHIHKCKIVSIECTFFVLVNVVKRFNILQQY